MSAKWRRSLAWDDRFFPAWAAPAKWTLRAFSSIWLAVILLVLVSLYGIVASVPIGLLALIPTWAVYIGTVLLGVLVLAAVPSGVAWKLIAPRSRGLAFACTVLTFLILTPVAAWLWHRYAWPSLHFDPATGEGVRFFADFAASHESVTLRHLPGFEMSELEFYSWWPMRVLLLAFVVNMVIATFRRIEFCFKNLGVLTVHTGIVTIALGSVYYQSLKKEGDTILIAGSFDEAAGRPGLGAAQRTFYDNTHMALYVDQFRGWQQRPISGVPRYNAYNLDAGVPSVEGDGPATLWALTERTLDRREETGRDLRVRAPDVPASESVRLIVDEDLRFEIVGYAPYAAPERDWRRVPEPTGPNRAPDFRPNPLQVIELISRLEDESGRVPEGPVFRFALLANDPAHRISSNQIIALEMTRDMPASRWRDLAQRHPAGPGPMLVIEIPSEEAGGRPTRRVIPAAPEVPVQLGGFRIEVQELHAEPPFPIVTEGYVGASTEVAIVRVTTPTGETFDRWVYHAFPEISQDLLDPGESSDASAMASPSRRVADESSIRLGYVPHSGLRVYFDEVTSGEGGTRVRAIVRDPDGGVRVFDPLPEDGVLRDAVPLIDFRLGEHWAHAEAFDRPVPVAESERDRSFTGTHEQAMFAVKVSGTIRGRRPGEAASEWSETRWVPFTRFLGLQGEENARRFDLPDGRRVRVAVGRRQHPLPGFQLRLVDFEMIAYDHRGAPRDYQSMVRVEPVEDRFGFVRTGLGANFEAFEHVTKLNAPLTAPHNVYDAPNPVVGVLRRLVTGVSPNQYKFSQAGWDRANWEETQVLADQGLLERPYAMFTILGVGNNPGIHVIALGGIMMGVGIPWAFYLKPYLVRREKQRLAEAAARGEIAPPPRAGTNEGASI
ncbi:MAG: hypothetical protein EA378_01895 [Phycisphaerales bacterium]|nr:MAG: hypothetical protein EA378_01895 [Phycisphaerales bacterium]